MESFKPGCRAEYVLPILFHNNTFYLLQGDLGALFHIFASQWDQRVLGLSTVLQDSLFNPF